MTGFIRNVYSENFTIRAYEIDPKGLFQRNWRPAAEDYINKIYPGKMTRIKTAIVVETDAQSAMALLFSQIAENLPFEIEVFTDFQAAEGWIINK